MEEMAKDEISGRDDDDDINGGKENDNLQGNEGDDKIDGGDGDDEIDGGDGKDDLKGGKGADRFVCDKEDKIVDYNSLENDKILGQCNYEDKGLIPPEPVQDKAIPKNTSEKNPLFPNSEIPIRTGNKFEKRYL